MLNLPIVPIQVTLRGNVGSLDTPRTAHLFTFGPWGQGNAPRRCTGSKNQQKIGETNGMPSRPIVQKCLIIFCRLLKGLHFPVIFLQRCSKCIGNLPIYKNSLN